MVDRKRLIRARTPRLFVPGTHSEEMRDLAGTPAGVAATRALLQRLLEIQREIGDPLNLAPFFPELAAEGDGRETR